ncbi:MAG TPA: FecR domain-containing protein [Terriglobales bacterium]|nr:FecR domain-containing protein [Terriglobales bacterium]
MTVRSPHHLLAEARHWYVRLQDDAVTQVERRAFARWLTADADHRRAWDTLMDQLRHLEHDLAAAAPLLAARYPMGTPGTISPASAAAIATVIPFPQRLARRQALRLAAAVGTVLLGGGLLVRHLADGDDFQTGPAERRQVQLADGSAIEIGSDTDLAVNFTTEERLIRLHGGDAFFAVAADAARPFIVQAGDVRVQALGTQFSLRARDETLDITVREHAVAVAVPGEPTRRVAAGEGMRVTAGRMGAIAPVDLDVAEAWRQDRMVFTDAALADVVAEIERYRHGQIIITDQALAALRVSGSFRADDTDAALRIIAAALPVRIDDFLGLVTLIRPVA